MSTLKTNTLSNVAGTSSTAIENAIHGSAKAWVNFNGTGTVAIRASYNVSSITDNGTGDYTINFTNALTDANYSIVAFAQDSSTKMSVAGNADSVAPTTTAYKLNTSSGNAGTSLLDSTYVFAAVFR